MRAIVLISIIIIAMYFGYKYGVMTFDKKSYMSNVQSMIDSLNAELWQIKLGLSSNAYEQSKDALQKRKLEIENILKTFNQ